MNVKWTAAAALSLMLALGLAATETSAKEKTRSKARSGRALASLAPVRPESQGQIMLQTVKSPQPRFLMTKESVGPVRLAGFCRDGNGVAVNSTQAGYESCVTSQANHSGKVDTYWGAAQRQAGAGILIGK